MDLSLEIITILFIVAAVAGFIDAIAGGGGLLTVPALLSVGLSPAQALATNKLQGSFGSFSATLYFIRNGVVKFSEMRNGIICTFIGAALGAVLVQKIDASVLTAIIPLLLLGISFYFLLAPKSIAEPGESKLSENMFALTVGTSIGFYDGFFGPGAGALFTICFVAIAKRGIIEATAKTKVLNFTSNIAALLFFIIGGLPVWEVGLLMAAGQFIGARSGAKIVVTKGQKLIRPMVVIVSMVMAIKLLIEQNPQWFQ
ncbi:TSUP family transporter [Photobacterium sp.]|uniref:TSUP family transporter n=1 Tax=Photobacterium sp. TaxID=660 RepID=UPI00299D347B|nr:TSUP family transporter [Photobacterium sp.]MDX1301906.1 TSUP family transporter [Photobacterium sp.]